MVRLLLTVLLAFGLTVAHASDLLLNAANEKYAAWMAATGIATVLQFAGIKPIKNTDRYILTLRARDPSDATGAAKDASRYLRSVYAERQGVDLETKLKAQAGLLLSIPTSQLDLEIIELYQQGSWMLSFSQEFLDKTFPPKRFLGADDDIPFEKTVDIGKSAGKYFIAFFNKHGCNASILERAPTFVEVLADKCQKVVLNEEPSKWERVHVILTRTEEKYTERAQGKAIHTIRLTLTGEYAAGLRPPNGSKNYRPMEPQFASELTIFGKSRLTEYISSLK